MSGPYTPHPLRIQRQRTKGWRMPAGAVYVGRPTKWGNPFPFARLFRKWLETGECEWQEHCTRPRSQVALDERQAWMLQHVHELRGKKLACWCPLDQPCHADVLAELANQ